MKRFTDRTAVVTGGASGLGAAMARLFAAEGMRVVVADIAVEGAADVARSLEASGASAVAAWVDVGDPASLAALAETAARAFGGCDLLAANVGVQRIARFEATTRDEFAWLIHTNVVGTADTVRAFLPQLRASPDAHVLITGSVGSLVATRGLVGYAASKMAVLGLAEGLRLELAPHGIAVTALLPGGMATTHLASSDRARPAQLGAAEPLDPTLIGDVVATLAPTPDAMLEPARAIRNLIAALREERPYLVTHGPIPAAFEERIAALRAAVARADEGRIEGLTETIPAAVAASISARPDAEAVVEAERRVTYRELGELVADSTRAMIAAGVERGDRVAIWAPNGLGWIVAALGAQSAGAALVPINTRFKGEEAAYVLSAAKAVALVTTVGFLDTDPVGMLRAAGTPLPHLRRIVLLPGSADAAEAPAGIDVEHWHAFAARAEQVTATAASERRRSVRPTDTSDVLFTSGTTGRPKGAIMTHGQTVRQFREWCAFAGLRPGDRYLIVNPFFHMFGYKAGWLASLLTGATIVPVPVFDVARVLSLVETERITVLPGAPTIYRSILDHPGLAAFDLHTLRVAVTGAADIPVELIREMRAKLPFRSILTGYGLTEAGTCTGSRPEDDEETIATTAGRAMDGLEIIVADAKGQEVERGATGELLVRGYSVMQGYLDDPEATARAVDERGFLHTGDLATLDERGYVRIVGRLKDMLIVGGFNVYPAEVENVLLGHAAIGQVAVVGVSDRRMGEVPVAYVVPAPGRSVEPDAILRWARERLANYKVPRHVVALEALPINATGKVVKEELRARAAADVKAG